MRGTKIGTRRKGEGYHDSSHRVVYYESINRELKIKPIYECRCDERLQTKTKRFTRPSYTGLVVELEHLKIKTRLTMYPRVDTCIGSY